ncbi:MAG: hypothetical protein J6K92_12525 [Oscillospiraceae bacterium]|nr:hypothetical protein [Oscillospiraceae bacterium]
MDDMALFAAGYYAGKKKGGASPSPLSLEGIKNLKTLATVTIGSFVFEIKEPKLFYSPALNLISGGAAAQTAWMPSVVVNDSIAYISSGTAGGHEYFAWGSYTDNDGNNHSTYFQNCSDFIINDVGFYGGVPTDRLPNISVEISCKVSSGYDGIVMSTWNSSSTAYIDAQYTDDVKFTNLSLNDYYNFMRSYCEAAAANEPVITIL